MPRSPLTADLVSRPSAASAACASGTRAGTQRKKREAQRAAVHRVAPRSTQVGFTRLASSNCRSRASPRSVSRYARPGHEGSPVREANRWLRSLLTMSNSAVFFVPAARLCARVCPSVRLGLGRGFGAEPAVALAAIPASAIPFHPDRGVDGAPTGHSFRFVARARRDLRALRRGLSRSERDLSRRSTMAIFGRDRCRCLRE
jgi:hypothetical protein